MKRHWKVPCAALIVAAAAIGAWRLTRPPETDERNEGAEEPWTPPDPRVWDSPAPPPTPGEEPPEPEAGPAGPQGTGGLDHPAEEPRDETGRAPLRARSYELQPESSLLYVLVHKDPTTLAAGLAHDHAIRATRWKGTVHHDPNDLSAFRVEIEIEVSGLRADEAEVRKLAGLGREISESDIRDIERSMKGSDQLDAKKHPTIRFESSAARGSPAGSGTLDVAGRITIRGKAKEVEVPVEYRIENGAIRARCRFKLRHSDFDIEPYSAVLGAVRNAQEIEFVVDAAGKAVE